MTPAQVLALMGAAGMPPLGPCALCGADDARHRVADTAAERISAGEDPAQVLADYGLGDVR